MKILETMRNTGWRINLYNDPNMWYMVARKQFKKNKKDKIVVKTIRIISWGETIKSCVVAFLKRLKEELQF